MSDDTFHGLALGLIVGIVATVVLMLFFAQHYHKAKMVENGCGQYDKITGEFKVIKRNRLKE